MSALPPFAVPGKFTRRLAAVTLLGQAMTIFFGALVARQFAVADGDPDGRATTYLIGGSALAVLCIAASGMLRRPGGVLLGWVIQVLTFATAIVLPAMIGVGLIFTGVWWLCLDQGHKVDAITARWEAEADGESSQQQPKRD
ncbi:hypothetical protein BH23ACT6_BH23ACT6_26610 [soil metagenome]